MFAEKRISTMKKINLENAEESFIIYKSWAEMINVAPDNETMLEMFIALFEYCGTGEDYTGENPFVKMLLAGVRPSDTSAKDRWINSKENGRKGGRPTTVDRDMVIELRLEGKTQMAIAEELNCSVDSVKKICQKHKKEEGVITDKNLTITTTTTITDTININNTITDNVDIDTNVDIDNNIEIDTNIDIDIDKDNNIEIDINNEEEIDIDAKTLPMGEKDIDISVNDVDVINSPIGEELLLMDKYIDNISLVEFNSKFRLDYSNEDISRFMDKFTEQLSLYGHNISGIEFDKLLNKFIDFSDGNKSPDNNYNDYFRKQSVLICFDIMRCISAA